MLYGKATDVALTKVDTASSLTLMSADIERIVTGMETSHEVRTVVVIFFLSRFILEGHYRTSVVGRYPKTYMRSPCPCISPLNKTCY